MRLHRHILERVQDSGVDVLLRERRRRRRERSVDRDQDQREERAADQEQRALEARDAGAPCGADRNGRSGRILLRSGAAIAGEHDAPGAERLPRFREPTCCTALPFSSHDPPVALQVIPRRIKR